jgi:hypothetical protein
MQLHNGIYNYLHMWFRLIAFCIVTETSVAIKVYSDVDWTGPLVGACISLALVILLLFVLQVALWRARHVLDPNYPPMMTDTGDRNTYKDMNFVFKVLLLFSVMIGLLCILTMYGLNQPAFVADIVFTGLSIVASLLAFAKLYEFRSRLDTSIMPPVPLIVRY